MSASGTAHAPGRSTAPSATPLAGMTALVTGGGRGLGATISELLAGAGARVALTGRDPGSLAAWAERLPHDPVVVPADLTHPDVRANVLDPALRELGSLDILVNNAGAVHFGAGHELSALDVDALVALNLRAPLLLGAAAAAHMAGRGGGSIVNISSGLGEIGSAGGSLYAATKGGLDALTRALAAEWGPHQVRVNAVRAGLIRSEAAGFLTGNDHLRHRYEQRVPLRRLAENRDVAEAVLFLASPAAAYITAQVLNVDGGSSTTAPSPLEAEEQ